MAALDLNERKRLPRGVTTGAGTYTSGTPIASRSQGTGPRVPSRVDFSSTPALQRAGQQIGQFVGSHSNPLLPAAPSTGRYTQSNVGRNRQRAIATPAQTHRHRWPRSGPLKRDRSRLQRRPTCWRNPNWGYPTSWLRLRRHCHLPSSPRSPTRSIPPHPVRRPSPVASLAAPRQRPGATTRPASPMPPSA